MGQAHVGQAELGDDGPVAELDHRVHYRLRVYDHIHVVDRHVEELVSLDDLEALVHERRGVHRDLGAHRPRGVGQRLLDGDTFEVFELAATERAAAGGQQYSRETSGAPVDLARTKALVDRTMLGVHRHDLGARGPLSPHYRPGGDQ